MTMKPILFLREQVADVGEAELIAQPDGIINCPAWLIGHLTFACQELGATRSGPRGRLGFSQRKVFDLPKVRRACSDDRHTYLKLKTRRLIVLTGAPLSVEG